MNKLILCAILALVASASGAPNPKEAKKNNQPILIDDGLDITSDLLPDGINYKIDEEQNRILAYNPVDPKPVRVVLQREPSSKLKSSSYTDYERESSHSSSSSVPKVANVMAEGDDAERSGSPNVDKIKDIAMNSREVRMVGSGPNQKEVEMKDDLPTKVVVALENLQKEAQEVLGQVNERLDKGWTEIKRSEVWGQVNERLDKGWTDLKSMVEGVVSPSTKSQG